MPVMLVPPEGAPSSNKILSMFKEKEKLTVTGHSLSMCVLGKNTTGLVLSSLVYTLETEIARDKLLFES